MLIRPVPGQPQRTNSFPSAAALSPDGHTLALLANGFGTASSGGAQSIVLVDRATGRVTDVPDPRLAYAAAQTAFVGLAWAPDGTRLYASFASISDPEGKGPGATGNGVAVYTFVGGTLTPGPFLPVPLRTLPADRHLAAPLGAVPAGTAAPYPAGLAPLPGDRLLVAGHLSDEAIVLDVATGKVLVRIDVGTGPEVPRAWPYGVVATPDGHRGWISLWNGSAVAELDLDRGIVTRTIPLLAPAVATDPGSHPTAMVLSADARTLYVTLGNADAVAVLDARSGRLRGTWSTRTPGETHGGSVPDALALSSDGAHLFVADAGANAVAVLSTRDGHAEGFVPTEWYPTALAVAGNDLYVATGKGIGTGPNNGPPPAGSRRKHPYIASILPGSVARLSVDAALADLPRLSAEVRRSNRVEAAEPTIPFAEGPSPIRHVVYIVKENRTYDQILGDLGVGDGDPSLVLYGKDVTPNEHALAREFGVLDHFYCSGEVSGDGHVWSTAATSSDYTERTWQIGYRSDEHTYDYEGQVLNGFPLEQGQPDIDTPGTGYLWSNAERAGLSHMNYGEFVTSLWCDDPAPANPGVMGTPLTHGDACAAPFVPVGQPLGGAPNPWPWPIPILSHNLPTMQDLRGHASPTFADFRMDYPDQLRADTFLADLAGWVGERAAGRPDPMPSLVILRLPNDHTAGTKPGFPTPSASVADNDLALGRVVEAVSHSVYWDDTAILVLEDDAQDGADHVDAHRSIAFAISRYSPSRADRPLVDSTPYTTVSTLHTAEVLLGLPAMNNNDAWAPVFAPLFAGPGDHPAFVADTRNRDNGLLYQTNAAVAPGAGASAGMDFRHADQVDTALLNAILWQDRKGDAPMPKVRSERHGDDD